jgi:ABC-type lipopolysaccharide export system ATPase subunit
MRTNIEIQELFKQADIVVTIKKGRIRWAGHVQRMAEARSVKKVFLRKT